MQVHLPRFCNPISSRLPFGEHAYQCRFLAPFSLRKEKWDHLKGGKKRYETLKNISPRGLIASSKQDTFSSNDASVTDNHWFPIVRISNESGRSNDFNFTGSNKTVKASRAHTSFIVCSHTPKERMRSSQRRASWDFESFELGERVYSERRY